MAGKGCHHPDDGVWSTRDAAGAITRLVELGVERFLLSSVLRGVLAQRLIRRVCARCATDGFLLPDQVVALGLKVPVERRERLRVRFGEGCPECRHTGLYGRTGVFEMLDVGRRVRALVNEGRDASELTHAAKIEGMETLREASLDDRKLADTVLRLADAIVASPKYAAQELDINVVRALLYLERHDPRIDQRIRQYLHGRPLTELARQAVAGSGPAAIPGRLRSGLVAALLLLAAAGAAIAPWTLRNARVHGRLVLIESTGGKNLVRGNNPFAPSNWDWGDHRPSLAVQATGCAEQDLIDRDRCLTRAGLRYIASHPGQFVRDAWIKLADLANPTSFAVRHIRVGVYGDWPRPLASAVVLVVALYNVVLMAGAVIGWLLHRDPDTYRYIPASIRLYPGAEGVAALMKAHGFSEVRHSRVLGGLMAIHQAWK